MMHLRLPRHSICNDDSQYHSAHEQRHEYPRDHRTAVSFSLPSLASLGLLVALFAVDMRLRAEHARESLREGFLRLLLRVWCQSMVMGGSVVLNIVLGHSGILCCQSVTCVEASRGPEVGCASVVGTWRKERNNLTRTPKHGQVFNTQRNAT
jgi:hypothetical protein